MWHYRHSVQESEEQSIQWSWLKSKTNLFFEPKSHEHLLKCFGHCDASVRLRKMLPSITDKEGKRAMYLSHFDNVKKESQHVTLVLKVYSPCHKGPVIWRCPHVRCKV
jgi:hypothetical protein